ncbi:MAG: helix-turn-helix transcriptional regulator [Cellulophaga sp.]|nr:helix-turn-helix transcriptional regulator [Cellulophaga sp.]
MIPKEKLFKIFQNEYHTNVKAFEKLTIREKEVIKYIVEGNTSNEIALQLNISKNTVDTHRKNIYKKLKIKSNYKILLFSITFDLL